MPTLFRGDPLHTRVVVTREVSMSVQSMSVTFLLYFILSVSFLQHSGFNTRQSRASTHFILFTHSLVYFKNFRDNLAMGTKLILNSRSSYLRLNVGITAVYYHI